MLYSTQYIQNVITLTCTQDKIIHKIFYVFVLNLWNSCAFYISSTFQFRHMSSDQEPHVASGYHTERP